MRICIIGSGNVASVMAKTLYSCGHSISVICGRNKKTASKLATTVDALYINHPSEIPDISDIYIIATDDRSIADVVKQLQDYNKTVVHTSGATAIDVLQKFKSHGVLYPINSITAKLKAVEEGTFFCIEANSSTVNRKLRKVVTDIKCKSVIINSKERLAVHVAAVFANNFVNALYQASYNLLQEQNLKFDIIKPLLLTTLNNALITEPRKHQTGPAVRKDTITLKKHLSFLKSHPELKTIYSQLSKLIEEQQK
ncbi:MAG: DUF2520 domain-containing protein [Bacteroidota bacterium]